MTFSASPQLAGAVRRALHVFARHKPHLFKLAHENSADASLFVDEWARALIGVTLEAIPDAAQRWVATRTEIPSVAAFGQFARDIDYAEYRPPVIERHSNDGDRGRWPRGVEPAKDFGQVDKLGRRAHALLGDWQGVSEVWGLLWKTAPTMGERARVRAGDVDDDMFDEAMRIVLAQRSTSSPKTAVFS